MKQQKMLNTNKGITLIALVITIIVMLILVAVTISMTINGGLFEYAKKAVGDTKNAIDIEQQLANGAIQIGGVWYDSIDDYLTGNGKDKRKIIINYDYDKTENISSTTVNLSFEIQGLKTYEEFKEMLFEVEFEGKDLEEEIAKNWGYSNFEEMLASEGYLSKEDFVNEIKSWYPGLDYENSLKNDIIRVKYGVDMSMLYNAYLYGLNTCGKQSYAEYETSYLRKKTDELKKEGYFEGKNLEEEIAEKWGYSNFEEMLAGEGYLSKEDYIKEIVLPGLDYEEALRWQITSFLIDWNLVSNSYDAYFWGVDEKNEDELEELFIKTKGYPGSFEDFIKNEYNSQKDAFVKELENTLEMEYKEALKCAVVNNIYDGLPTPELQVTMPDGEVKYLPYLDFNTEFIVEENGTYTVSAVGTGGEKGSVDIVINNLYEPNFDEIFATAKPHPNQAGLEKAEDIGIAEDGSIVDLSIWNYYLLDDEQAYSLGTTSVCGFTPGYESYQSNSDGKIKGQMPMYIKEAEESSFYPVTTLLHTFQNNLSFKVFPDFPKTITFISDEAFCYTDLEGIISIPKNVTKIGNGAFWRCGNVTEVEIPAGVTNIGEEAFYYCNKIEEVRFKNTNAPVFEKDCFYFTGPNVTKFYFENQSVADAFIASGCYNAACSEIIVGNK